MGFGTTDGIGLRALLDEAGYRPDFRWAWEHYQPVVKALSRRLGLRRLCEIGGGRNPLLSLEDVRALGASYAVNDISAGELALVPDGFATACFDVAAICRAAQGAILRPRLLAHGVRARAGRRQGLEQPPPPAGAGRRRLCLHSHPLFAALCGEPPRSGMAVQRDGRPALSASRPHGIAPQFKAYYDHCVSREATVRAMLEGSGFAECAVIPFWGHDYYRGLPVLRNVAARLSALAQRHDVRLLTSYAFVLARK